MDIEAIIKSGPTLQQSNLKLEGLNAGKPQVEEVKSVKERKNMESNMSCNTCTFLMDAEEKCLAKDLECFSHGRFITSVEVKSPNLRKTIKMDGTKTFYGIERK